MEHIKDYTLTVRQVIQNLGTLGDAYETVSRGNSPTGNYYFSVNAAEAAATMKASQMLISQVPYWIPVGERLPDGRETVLLSDGDWVTMGRKSGDEWYVIESAEACGYWEFSRLPFWMPLPEPPDSSLRPAPAQ